jgi:hypothetical protein
LKEETIMGEVPGGRRTGSENHHRGGDVFPTIKWDRKRSGKEERTKVFSEGSTETEREDG